jgi:hypothetical protein
MKRRLFLTGAPAAALLAACGGEDRRTPAEDGGEAGVGAGGSGGYSVGQVSGRIDGLGSVRVAGLRFDDRSARARLALDPLAPAEIPITDLRLGMEVTVETGTDAGLRLTAQPIVRGICDQMWIARGNLLRIGGQWIRVNAAPAQPTYLEGFRSWNDLLRLNMMEVHGQRGADGIIQASYIGTRLKTSPVCVVGTLDLFDNSNTPPGTFDIGEMTIWYEQARLAPGLTLEVGRRYAVYGRPLPAPWGGDSGIWTQAITIGPAEPEAAIDMPVTVNGLVEALPAPGLAVVRGALVDFSKARVLNGTAADIRTDSLVRAVGVKAAGTLRASEVALLPRDRPALFDVQSQVTDFIDAQSLLVSSAAVNAGAANFAGLAASNLGNAVTVKVSGTLANASLTAETVEAARIEPGQPAAFVGDALEYDTALRTFRVAGLTQNFVLAQDVQFVGITAAQFAAGVRVAVIGTLVADRWVVTHVRAQPAVGIFDLAGIAGQVGPAEFVLNANVLALTSATRFVGVTNTAADLTPGRYVRVRAARDASRLVALEVDARPSLSQAARVRGVVTKLITESQLSIGSQRVDAGAAAFVPPEFRTSFAPGAYCEAEGQMRDGVLVASRVYRL